MRYLTLLTLLASAVLGAQDAPKKPPTPPSETPPDTSCARTRSLATQPVASNI